MAIIHKMKKVARMLPDDYFTEYHYFGLKNSSDYKRQVFSSVWWVQSLFKYRNE